jgi:hypothetical protein
VLCLLYATNAFAATAATVRGDLAVNGNVYLNGTPLTSPDKLTRYQGTWSPQAYAAGDIVQHLGSLYIAISANSAQPPNTTYWSLLSAGATPVDFSGTYVGTQSEYFPELNVSIIETATTVIIQNGSSISGTFSNSNSGGGTFTGTLNGNIITFLNVFTQYPIGCTSGEVAGMGSIQNNKLTQLFSGTTVCNSSTLHFTGSGILTKQ